MEIRHEAGERYVLFRIREIPIIAGDGVTKAEALRTVRQAFDDYITWALLEGLEIPAPARPWVTGELVPEGEPTPAHDVATKGPATRKVELAAA
jgi:predicted RNase H-like HicB family nuclease